MEESKLMSNCDEIKDRNIDIKEILELELEKCVKTY